jgi:signal peptidase II
MSSKPNKCLALFFAIGIPLTAIDLLTKWWAFDALKVRQGFDVDGRMRILDQDVIVVIPGFFELEATLNTGAFSGWFGNFTPYLALLSFVAIFVIFGIVFVHVRKPEVDVLFVVALALVWSGTAGNFWDRWQMGAVRDFIKWFYKGPPYVWPNFNIADSAICVGVGLLFINVFRDYRAEKRRLAHEATAGSVDRN